LGSSGAYGFHKGARGIRHASRRFGCGSSSRGCGARAALARLRRVRDFATRLTLGG